MTDQNDYKKIKNWPKDERPREKLFKHGEQHLTDAELLAILLRTGTRGESVLDLTRKILYKFGDFRGMIHTDYRSWGEIKGVGDAKIAQIKAALEIGKRLSSAQTEAKIKIRDGKDVFNLLKDRLHGSKKEKFFILLLNSKNGVIRTVELVEGGVSEVRPFIRIVDNSKKILGGDPKFIIHLLGDAFGRKRAPKHLRDEMAGYGLDF